MGTVVRFVGLAVAIGSVFFAGSAGAQVAIVDGGIRTCSVDADCGDPYLACVATAVYICTDVDAATALTTPPGNGCLATKPATLNLCTPTYQQPCHVDSDCGPAGFTCNLDGGKSCSGADCRTVTRCDSTYQLCASDDECPSGWSCYSPPGGAGCAGAHCGADAGLPKACYPPFEVFFGGAASGGTMDGGPGAVTKGKMDGAMSSPDATPAPASVHSDAAGNGCSLASRHAGRGSASILTLIGVAFIARRRKTSA